jgi:hypothetical protein
MNAIFFLPGTTRPAWPLPALTALLLAGCGGGGPALHPVQGKVLLNGQPLKGALVTFHPKGADAVTAVRPVGMTGEDGTFTLTTGAKDGAPAGEYVVTFICPEEVVPKGKPAISTGPPESRDRLQGAYANAATSTFKVEVKAGPNQLEPFPLK